MGLDAEGKVQLPSECSPSQIIMTILGLIPARGGSKGIPGKNLVLLHGKPLLQYTCEAAKQSTMLTRVIVSTDDKKIADVAIGFGIEVPFLRPKELADDGTPMIDVLLHMLAEFKKSGQEPEILVLLQPTSPLRTSKDIDDAVSLLQKTGADTVVSVVEVPHQFVPGSLMRLEDGKLHPYGDQQSPLLRQHKQRLYARNGPAVLAIRTDFLKKAKGFYSGDTRALLMPKERSVDIDDAFDLRLAEMILQQAQ